MRQRSLRPNRVFLPGAIALLGILFAACSSGVQGDVVSPSAAELAFSDDTTPPLPSDSRSEPTDDFGAIFSDSDVVASSTTRRESPSIKIVQPVDGATVSQTFQMEVEIENFELQPKGRVVAGQGHWHAIVDQGCMEPGELIPSGSSHFHAGDGSTTRTIQLTPGPHELCVQIGDGFHVAVNISQTVNITVR